MESGPVRIAVVALVASFGLDLVAHALVAPGLEEFAHLAGLFAMVGTIVLILIRGTQRQGGRDAIR
jgi:hypothetical protein